MFLVLCLQPALLFAAVIIQFKDLTEIMASSLLGNYEEDDMEILKNNNVYIRLFDTILNEHGTFLFQ